MVLFLCFFSAVFVCFIWGRVKETENIYVYMCAAAEISIRMIITDEKVDRMQDTVTKIYINNFSL